MNINERPIIDVSKRARARRPKRKDVMIKGKLPSARPSTHPRAFTFENVSRERWARTFGQAEGTGKRGSYLWDSETQTFVRKDSAPANQSAAVFGVNKGAGRKMFRKVFDFGLGVVLEDRNHRNRLMKQSGLREAN